MINPTLLNECRALVESRRGELIALCQRLVQTPSLSGQEGAVAGLLLDAMRGLGYDESWIDAAGNVVGVVRGRGGPITMLNGHMDIVDPGQPGDWPQPPYSGALHEGDLWGRGSADMKSSLAGMLYAAGLFKAWGRRPVGDVAVCAAGLEELGGWGSHLLFQDGRLRADRAVVGEPTGNRLFLGHRGRIILQAQIKGRSTHGSVVDYEANPLLSLGRFLDGLPGLSASLAGRASYLTMAPTALTAAPAARNVTPADVVQTLDVRVGPGVEAERVRQAVGGLLQSSLGTGCSGQVVVARQQVRTHTGIELDVEDVVPGYELAADHDWAGEARAALSAALGRDVGAGEIANYACDAIRLYQGAGMPIIIFGPGDIGVAHTSREHIPVDQVLEATVGVMGLVA